MHAVTLIVLFPRTRSIRPERSVTEGVRSDQDRPFEKELPSIVISQLSERNFSNLSLAGGAVCNVRHGLLYTSTYRSPCVRRPGRGRQHSAACCYIEGDSNLLAQ